MSGRNQRELPTARARASCRLWKSVWRGVALMGALIAFPGATAAVASADQVGIAVQAGAPEQGVPLTLNFTGTARAIDQSGDGPYLYAVIRPTGGIACQASYGTDQAAAGGASQTFFTYGDEVSPGSFAVQTTYNPPDVGSYSICAWLENQNGDGIDETYPPSIVTAGPAQGAFATRGPQVGQLSVTLPSPARPGVAYQVNYTTQTDQQLSLYSVVKRAGGLPCASSNELEQQQNQSESDMFDSWDGASIFGGPVTTTATDTEDTAGPYVICTWIEGPNSGEVDSATSTPIYVGTPPPPPPPVTPPACVVPRFAGVGLSTVERRLIGHHCTIGRIRYVHSHAHRGTVLELTAVVGQRLAHDARVGIVVSTGRHRRHGHV